ncbi:aminopeptidase P family protein [Segatella copri]|uniref:Aminopeptidase P family protein n=1 Tax=Segatella copri TaxID=165179 RepID=A0AAW5IQ12_9BACT|nr:aminopeptidase P family protein [Segatella copri]MCP9552260.1 aminopeptidase P family protein [Segatella copri]MCP9572860.1 aminopeptidase P family protein [Segatella copri]MCP9576038.1 aminopeptidase P family protein [Segatella copri]MCP9578895.1 aminopeptidase P family protein [Segatella copri]MCP9581930.1 aminopeptidase P family protein [Segatella copri]
MNEIELRLARLRELMKREHLSAFIFPSTDAHQSEYVADHWRGREWISGFNGSAGTAVVTMKSAALWTDSRYFLAAEEQLEDTEYQLMRLKMEGTPTIAEWLGKELQDVQSPEVGLDGMVNSYNYVKDLSYSLRKLGGITLRTNLDPLEQIWENRPSLPANPVEIQPLEYAGETLASKVVRIRKSLRELHADGMLVSALDDIAWTLNLRGTDVHCNPVFVSYLLIESDKVSLFVDDNKLSPEVKLYLQDNQVSLYNYNKVEKCLESYSEYNILLDGDETSYYLWKTVKCQEIVAAASPIPAMKAVKNEAEIEGYRSAMLKDGVAMVKFLKWLKPAVEAGGQTEISIDEKLTSLRAEQKLFRDISFDTIAGYAQHGAIVHYEATPETDVVLKPEGLILIDSGAQYQDGTTDITRTIALGPVSEEMKHIYTLVLKAHIQLELVKFPDGASGTQLDAVGRECMWREGYNFLHGTGHGVGSYLCVHEGPHQIRMEWMPTPLRAGMTLTDEPGLYLAGKFGVRIENTVLISDYMSTEFGKFLQIEPLTLCPIDTTPIDVDMLLPEEIDWLNAYHHSVYKKLSPFLDEEEKIWLENATKPIK